MELIENKSKRSNSIPSRACSAEASTRRRGRGKGWVKKLIRFKNKNPNFQTNLI